MKEREKGLFSPWFAQSMLKAKSRERVAANCLSIAHTSISPSNSEESSKVTLKGMVLSRLDPFWGDFRFFGDVFSDISSVSLCSSRCFEFCSCTSIKKQRQSNKTVLDLIRFPWCPWSMNDQFLVTQLLSVLTRHWVTVYGEIQFTAVQEVTTSKDWQHGWEAPLKWTSILK